MAELLRAPNRWLEQNTLLWQRWAVVLIALLLTAAITYIAAPGNTTLVLVGLLAIAGGIVAVHLFLRWPGLGLVALIPANMVIPFTIGTGTGTSIHATILLLTLLGGLWVYELLHPRRKLRLKNSPPISFLILFLIVSVISFFVGQLPWFLTTSAPLTAQLGGLSVFVFSILAFLLAAHQFRDMRWMEIFTWTLLAFGAFYLVFRIVPGLFRYSGNFFTWSSTSSQFWNWFLAMSFAQFLLNTRLRRPQRVALFILFAVGFYAAFFQTFDWQSGWLPAVVSITVILALYDWRLAALVVVAGIVVIPSVLQELIAVDEYSYSTRVDAWLILFEIIRVNPFLGLGPANYYYYTPLYEIRGYAVSFNSHNQYIDLVAQVGFIGLFFIMGFFVAVWRLGWDLRERVPEGFSRAYVYGALGGLVGTVASGMLGDWFLPFVYNVSIAGLRSSILGWLFLGGLLAIHQMVRNGNLPALQETP